MSDNLMDIFNTKTAPNVVGKPVFKNFIEKCKFLGADRPELIIGKMIDDADLNASSIPLNFGSRKSTGLLADEERIALFALKKAISNVQIQAQFKAKTQYPSKAVMESVPEYKRELLPLLKAFDITTWAEFIDQLQARFYFEEYELPFLLADKFDSMPMASSLLRVPGALGRLFGRLETDDATFTAQSNTPSSYLVEAKNNVVHTQITNDLLDDSAPAIIDKLRKEVVAGIMRSYERTILDGDATAAPGVHQDADVVAGTDFRKAFKGLRKAALDNVANGSVYDHLNDTPSKALWSEVLKKMGKYGSDKRDLLYIIGSSISHDLVSGAIPELFTAFAFGSVASNVTGAVPPVFGIENVESEWVREDLAATGVHTAVPADDTRTYLLCVKKSRCSNWIRQATRVWAAPSLPSSDQMLMSGKARHAFAFVPQTASEKSVTIGINVKIS
jgi:hypothetical protein